MANIPSEDSGKSVHTMGTHNGLTHDFSNMFHAEFRAKQVHVKAFGSEIHVIGCIKEQSGCIKSKIIVILPNVLTNILL